MEEMGMAVSEGRHGERAAEIDHARPRRRPRLHGIGTEYCHAVTDDAESGYARPSGHPGPERSVDQGDVQPAIGGERADAPRQRGCGGCPQESAAIHH